jgi:hypothetical protein
MGSSKEEQHPVVEIASSIDHVVDWAGHLNEVVKIVAGNRAFRVYSELKGQFEMNTSGNLQGMVKSARWRLLFKYSSNVGKHLENMGTLAAFAANVAEMWDEFEAVAKSSDSVTLKGMRFAAAAGTAAERTLLGAVPAGTHLIYLSLQGWCQIAGLAGGKIEAGANECLSVLQSADAIVKNSFSAITDTGNQSKVLSKESWSNAYQWVVDLNLLPRSAQLPAGAGKNRESSCLVATWQLV